MTAYYIVVWVQLFVAKHHKMLSEVALFTVGLAAGWFIGEEVFQ